jgi:AraC-like DNA-binding protein
VGYINEKKMEHAAFLLSLMMSVQDVCESVNIMDPSQFSRLFKKHLGLSPKQYQTRYLQHKMNRETKTTIHTTIEV